MLHAFVFTQLPGLINLNISHNNIHTISQQSFHLPKLNILDLAFNNIEVIIIFNNIIIQFAKYPPPRVKGTVSVIPIHPLNL